MGYESKIYVIRKHKSIHGDKDWDDVIATFDLCKMGYDEINGKWFRRLFTEPVGTMYADDGNTEITEDCYGDAVEGAPVYDVLLWMSKWLETNTYNRAKAFYRMLIAIAEEIDGDLWCYHYGY